MPTIKINGMQLPSFPDLSNFFHSPHFARAPERMEPQLPPSNALAAFADMMDHVLQQAPPLPEMFSGFRPSFPSPMGFFGPPGPPGPLMNPPEITVVRVIQRPDYVPHECFEDVVNFCQLQIKDEDKAKTLQCMKKNTRHFNPACRTLLLNKTAKHHKAPVHHKAAVPVHHKAVPVHHETATVHKAAVPEKPAEPVVQVQATAFEAQHDDSSAGEFNSSMYYAGAAGGVIAFAVVGVVLMLQRRRDEEAYKYESILSPDEDGYDEYA